MIKSLETIVAVHTHTHTHTHTQYTCLKMFFAFMLVTLELQV